MKRYTGSCHCGAIRFSFEQEVIEKGLRCNCSICARKGAIMSAFTLAPEELTIDADARQLGLYQFGTNVARHYFCKVCGIYPFHATMRIPGHYRVNLGCIHELESCAIAVETIDGRSFPAGRAAE